MMKSILCVSLAALSLCSGMAKAQSKSQVTSVQILSKIVPHYFEDLHYKPIGVCQWLDTTPTGPVVSTTLEVDHFLPDLVVTVFNNEGDDPWLEANTTIDQVSEKTASSALEAVSGFSLGNGDTHSIQNSHQSNAIKTKTVDVVGAPSDFLQTGMATISPNTSPYMPYYQSDLDVPGRLGVDSFVRTESFEPFGHSVGSGFHDQWASEFPREMEVDNNNDYKASVVMALRAADLVTNRNTGHIIRGTSDNCGTNCAVSGVVEEQSDTNEIFEEVWPNYRHIKLGQSDSTSINPIGQADFKAGEGNYVFVVWRHYRGCIRGPGQLIFATVQVPPYTKR